MNVFQQPVVWSARVALVLGCLATAHAGEARRFMATGEAAFNTSNYPVAALAFSNAAARAVAEKLDPAPARFNAALAYARAGRMEEATRELAEAAKAPDLALQSQALFNQGTLLLGAAAAAEREQQLDVAGKAIDGALNMFENAMMLAPEDKDPKVNYELALKKKEQLEQQRQQQNQNEQQQNQNEQKPDQNQSDQKDSSSSQDQRNESESKDQDSGQEQKKTPPDSRDQPTPPPADAPQEQKAPDGKMSPEEARAMLDNMKDEEQNRREQLRVMMGEPVPVEKDW